MSLASKARCCLLTPESPCITSYRGPRLHAAAQTCSLTLRPAAPEPVPDRSSEAPRPNATSILEGAGLPSGISPVDRGVERRRACSEPPSQRSGAVVSPAEKAWTLKAFGVRPGIDDTAYQRRPQTSPPSHEVNKVESIKALHAFGISTGIDDDPHQRRRVVEAPIPRPTRTEVERMALASSDITGIMARRHFHGAPPLGSFRSNYCRFAALDDIDIDVHRGRRHFEEVNDCTQPWTKPSYDDAVGTTLQATRRHFFEMQLAANRFAEFFGRPHIRKPSEMPALPAARSEWLRLKGLEEGWQLLGSWHRTVFAKKKSIVPMRPLWELEMHNQLCSIVVAEKSILNEDSFTEACLEKPRRFESFADEENCDASTATPTEESVVASEEEPVSPTELSPRDWRGRRVRRQRSLSRITERDDDAVGSDEVHAAKLPLALRRAIGAAMAGREETRLHKSESLSAQIQLLVGTSHNQNHLCGL